MAPVAEAKRLQRQYQLSQRRTQKRTNDGTKPMRHKRRNTNRRRHRTQARIRKTTSLIGMVMKWFMRPCNTRLQGMTADSSRGVYMIRLRQKRNVKHKKEAMGEQWTRARQEKTDTKTKTQSGTMHKTKENKNGPCTI